MVPSKVQPLLPKQMVPDYGKSQRENYSHIKTRLLDYHDSFMFYSNRVTASGPIATSKQKHPVIL